MRVAVVGGGIGGLCTAHALKHHGIEAIVVERAPELSEVGAGIQIASNAAIVLREIGLEQAIRAVGVKPQSYDYRDLRTGRMLYKAPLGDEAAGRYGAPMYNIHRADLVQILFDAVPSEAKRLGARCTAMSQDKDGVEVRLQTGETLRADALVGCDGIHSLVREHLRGSEEKHFANILMWRSLIPAERLEGLGLEECGNYWFGPGRTLITYWVRPKNLYSILASVPADEVQRESWTESGDISEMLRSFEDAEPRGPCSNSAKASSSRACITAIRSTAGPPAASRCSGTPRIRWCRSSPRAPARASRTPGPLRGCCRGGRMMFPAHCSNTSAAACRVPRASRLARAPPSS